MHSTTKSSHSSESRQDDDLHEQAFAAATTQVSEIVIVDSLPPILKPTKLLLFMISLRHPFTLLLIFIVCNEQHKMAAFGTVIYYDWIIFLEFKNRKE